MDLESGCVTPVSSDEKIKASIRITGEDVTDVLDYVQFKADELSGRVSGFLVNYVETGNITQEEANEFLSLYKEGLKGYTYLLKSNS